jgi:hypothetical protein
LSKSKSITHNGEHRTSFYRLLKNKIMVIMGDFNTRVSSIKVHSNRNITPNGENISVGMGRD